MAFSTKVGSFTQPTSTNASFAVTGVGFQPKALIFFMNGQTADGSAAIRYHVMGMATDSTHRACVSFYQKDQNTQSDTRAHDDTKCLVFVDTTSTAVVKADLVSMDSDGFTLNFSVVDANARIVNYIALGGADLTNAFLKEYIQNSTTGNQALTGVGFQPTSIIFMGASNGTAPPNIPATGLNGSNIIYGVTTGTSTGGAHGNDYHDSRQKANDVIIRANGGGSNSLSQEATLVSFDSDGFTINIGTASGNRYVWALCLKGGQVKAGTFTQKTSTGSQATTGIGFQPTGLILFSANDVVQSAVNTSQSFVSFGAGNSSSSRGCIWSGVDANHADQNLDRTNIIKMMTPAAAGAPTTQAAADLTSLDSDGFTLTWGSADATAREIIYLAFGSNAATGARPKGFISMMGVGM